MITDEIFSGNIVPWVFLPFGISVTKYIFICFINFLCHKITLKSEEYVQKLVKLEDQKLQIKIENYVCDT